jgi:DNA gyrase/topoisomerase IV subunit B
MDFRKVNLYFENINNNMKTKTSIIDNAFDIEPSEFNEIIEYKDLDNLPSTNIIHDLNYDNKHFEIETQFQDVYDKAMNAFDVQQEMSEDIEGKYLARNSEVANQLLNTALSAAKEKSNLKKHSDNLKQRGGTAEQGLPGSTTNIQNNIVMDRNELLKIMGEK